MTHDDNRDERELRELLTRRSEVRDEEVEALRGFVAGLPARRARRRLGVLGAAASVTVLLGLGFVAIVGLSGHSGGARAPDFSHDPRLAACNAKAEDAEAIFELQHVSEYALQLPHAYPLVGLDADANAPALVIVFKGPGTPQRDRETPAPNSHNLCMVVGADAASWRPVAIVDVDTTGLWAMKPDPNSTPIATTDSAWVERCGGIEAGIFSIIHFADGRQALTLNSVPVPPWAVTDAPTTLIVYNGIHPFVPKGTNPPSGQTFAPRELGPGQHDLCLLAGSNPATATRTIVEAGIETAVASPRNEPAISPSSVLRPQISAADCAALGFSEGRCSAVVEQARTTASLDWSRITTVHLSKPAPGPLSLGGVSVADVTFTLDDGTSTTATTGCLFLGSQSNPACTEHPEIQLSMPGGGGYWDVPCGSTPGGEPGSACATPLPSIDPGATSVPLSIASHDYPLVVGHNEILVGQATLPNGILSDARFSLADPTTPSIVPDGAVTLEVRSTDPAGKPFANGYLHGWHPGSEVVNVYLVLDLMFVEPGTTLQVRNLVVR